MTFEFMPLSKRFGDSSGVLQGLVNELAEKSMAAILHRLEVQARELLDMGVPMNQITRLIDDSKLGTDGWQEMVPLRTDWVGK